MSLSESLRPGNSGQEEMKLSLILSVIHNKIRDSYLQALKHQLPNGTSADCANSLAL